MTLLNTAPSLDKKIFNELIKLLYTNGMGPIFGSMVLAILLGLVVQDSLPTFAPKWMLAAIILFGARLTLYYFVVHNEESLSINRRAWLFTLGSWLSGIFWGIGGWVIFDPNNEFNTMMIMILLNGIASGVVISLSSFPPAYLGYMSLSILPVLVKMLILGGIENQILLFIELFAFGLLIMWHRNTYHTFYSSIKLQFDNQSLIEKLQTESLLTKQAQHRAEQLMKEKSSFIASASHDLRQPLFAMQLSVAQLQKLNGINAHGAKYIRQLSNDIDYLSKMFNGLLDLSRLDSATMTPLLQSITLHPLLIKAVTDSNLAHNKNQSRVRVRCNINQLTCDPMYLHRILTNLINNAVKFSHGSILITARRRAETTQIRVFDQGVGIAQSDLPHIFTEYYQLANPGRNRELGFGMGLAIVKRLVEQLKGNITVCSELHRGTVFTVSLPDLQLPYMKAENIDSVNSSTNDVEFGDDFEHISILLVEDDEQILELLEITFADLGAQVYSANNVDAAITYIEQRKFDIVISDYRLGNKQNGVFVLEKASSKHPALIPILLTGDNPLEHSQRLDGTSILVVQKPVMPDQLVAIVHDQYIQQNSQP